MSLEIIEPQEYDVELRGPDGISCEFCLSYMNPNLEEWILDRSRWNFLWQRMDEWERKYLFNNEG